MQIITTQRNQKAHKNEKRNIIIILITDNVRFSNSISYYNSPASKRLMQTLLRKQNTSRNEPVSLFSFLKSLRMLKVTRLGKN